MSNMAQHDLTQRTLRPFSGFDQSSHLATQSRVIKYAQVNTEQCPIFRTELILKILCNLLDIGPNAGQRITKSLQLCSSVDRLSGRHRLQIRMRRNPSSSPNADTRASCDTRQASTTIRVNRNRVGLADRAGQLRVRNQPGQLRRDGN